MKTLSRRVSWRGGLGGTNGDNSGVGKTLILDMRDFLDQETGVLSRSLPSHALTLALFCGSIVAWVTDHVPDGDWNTNVPCRRSRGRNRCFGEIVAELDAAHGLIVWQCPICGDHGVIHGWEDTLWNRLRGARADSSDTPPTTITH